MAGDDRRRPSNEKVPPGLAEEVEVRGHIIDSLLLPKILDRILQMEGTFEIRECRIGARRIDPSYARIEIRADTPAKRIYLAVQLMYTSKEPSAHHEVYFALVRDILKAAPSVWPFIESINNHILTGQMYKALKDAKKLIAYEGELLDNAKRGASLRSRGETNRQSA